MAKKIKRRKSYEITRKVNIRLVPDIAEQKSLDRIQKEVEALTKKPHIIQSLLKIFRV